MRVLAVTNMYPSFDSPALGTFVEQQVKGLERIGLEMRVVYVERRRLGMRAYFGVQAQVRKQLAEFRPDLVHVMYGGIIAERVTTLIDTLPVIVSFCGSDLLGELLSGQWRKLAAQCGVWASHRAAKRASGIVVKSKNLRDALPPIVQPSKIRVIPNGIDLDRFKPLERQICITKLGWKAERFHILFPANGGGAQKRPDLARAAVRKILASGIDAEMHELQGVPHDEVPIWINGSNAVLLTSLHEGSPNIIKEALACNVPVVSVDVGDVKERVHGIAGCYISHSDPNDLASHLRLVHSGRARIAGRETMKELSLEKIAGCLKAFYEEVLESTNVKKRVNKTPAMPVLEELK